MPVVIIHYIFLAFMAVIPGNTTVLLLYLLNAHDRQDAYSIFLLPSLGTLQGVMSGKYKCTVYHDVVSYIIVIHVSHETILLCESYQHIVT